MLPALLLRAVLAFPFAMAPPPSHVSGDEDVGDDLSVVGDVDAASIVLDSTVTAALCAGDVTCVDANGLVGAQLTSGTTDPTDRMLRAGACNPADATCVAADMTICGGQDTSITTIDGADPSVSCAGDNDTVTVTVVDADGVSTATVLTEGTDWTASASVAATCASLATAVDALAGVSASCTSPDVLIYLDSNACRLTLAESTAGCTTVGTGTFGDVDVFATTLTVNGASTTTGLVTGGTVTSTGLLTAGGITTSAVINTTTADSVPHMNFGGTGATNATFIPVAGATPAIRMKGATATTPTSNVSDGMWVVKTLQVYSADTNSTSAVQMDRTNGFVNATGFSLTAGTMTNTNFGSLRDHWVKGLWTNAMVAALGGTAGDISFATLPANTVVERALVRITGQAAGVSTLTVACGRTGASYIDYIVASDAKAAVSTVYGDNPAGTETGTFLFDATAKWVTDYPSWTGTTVVNCHFISTGGNLSAVTGSSGSVYLQVAVLP
jgi:hypothetical protein